MNEPTIIGNKLSITFDTWGLDAYNLFLRSKLLPEMELSFDPDADTYTVTAPKRFATMLGIDTGAPEASDIPLAPHLFDYQRFIVETALVARRYAIWSACGSGKTAMILEFARHVTHRTSGRVLIMSPLQIIPQTIAEAAKFYGDSLTVTRLDTREELAAWCVGEGDGIAICNYEKMIPGVMNELRYLAGLILDESSILKSGGGVIKWNLIKSAKGIEYKLSCTATPAPNDVMEYASQASFLEKLRTEGEILWTFFTRNKRGEWSVKPHARDAFFAFMSGWSIYLQHPGRYGWFDIHAATPDPLIVEYDLPSTPEQTRAAVDYLTVGKVGQFLVNTERIGITQRTKLSQIAKGFIYEDKGTRVIRIPSAKPQWIADKIREDVADGRQVLVWTLYDAESDILAEALGDAPFKVEYLHGRVKAKDRPAMIDRFLSGETTVLVSKASMLGYGMNFQHCSSMIFSGWNDSWEAMYQAIHRAYRYGQTKQVLVHIPYISELEGVILRNVLKKRASFELQIEEQEANYLRALGRTLTDSQAAIADGRWKDDVDMGESDEDNTTTMEAFEEYDI